MISMSFSPIETYDARWHRRLLLRFFPFVAAVSRFVWSHSSDANSTFHETNRLWTSIWGISRYMGCLPRKESTCLRVNFADNVLMELDLSRLTDCFAYCFGLGESEIGYLFSHVCRHNDIILDIGANIGTTSLFFAKQCPNGTVHAYEPSKSMVSLLQKNIALNNVQNIEIHPYALSNKAGVARLKIEMQNNPGSAHITGDKEGEAVDICTLDEKPPTNQPIGFVKIDVEGYEKQVLLGGEKLIQSSKPIIVLEINSGALEVAGNSSASHIYHLLKTWGYQLFLLDKGKLIEFVTTNHVYGVFNLIAIHNEKQMLLGL